jgi:8-oxo-dGTP diphosphatase
MKILFATHNKAKLNLYKEGLEEYNIQVFSLDDLNIHQKVNENGSTTSENAYIKAREYSKISNMITIAVDDGLLFYDFPDERQPGVNVRRLNGEEKSDDELIEHYIKEIDNYGVNGELKGKWIKTLAIALNKDNIMTHDFCLEKIFVNKANSKRNPGYPFDSISLDPILRKYTVDLTKEEKKHIQEVSNNGVFEFVFNAIKTIKV